MKNVFKNEKEIFVIFRIHDVKKKFFCLKILKKNGKSINQSIYHLRCPPAESPGRRCRARPGARCAVPPPRIQGCRPPACTAGCAAHGVRPPSAPVSAGRRRPHPQDLSQFDLLRNFLYIFLPLIADLSCQLLVRVHQAPPSTVTLTRITTHLWYPWEWWMWWSGRCSPAPPCRPCPPRPAPATGTTRSPRGGSGTRIS